jgi:dynactin-4
MLVSYTYRSDDPAPSEENGGGTKSAPPKVPEIKTFAFYTVVDLGPIIPREESRVESTDI